MNEINVGIIGCGRVALEKHLPGLTAIEGVNVIAFHNTSRSKAEHAAAQFGAPGAQVYDSPEALFRNKDIDVVHICTNANTHAELSIMAMEAGKHVMCEKPMASNMVEAQNMLDTSQKTDKKLSIACQNRFREDSLFLKKVCEEGDLGEIYFAKAIALRRRAVPQWLLLSEAEQGGGPLLDIGTHALDLTLWMMDNFKPKMVVGSHYRKLAGRKDEPNLWGAWDPHKFFIPESAFAFIQMQDGATVMLESSWALNIRETGEARTLLCGTKGGADMSDGLWLNGSTHGSLYEKHMSFDKHLNFGINKFDYSDHSFYGYSAYAEAQSWIDCVRNDTEPVVKADEAFIVFKILEAIKTSAQTGKPVYFE